VIRLATWCSIFLTVSTLFLWIVNDFLGRPVDALFLSSFLWIINDFLGRPVDALFLSSFLWIVNDFLGRPVSALFLFSSYQFVAIQDD
jgi:hypothetical protein